jgi:hypothetical protein
MTTRELLTEVSRRGVRLHVDGDTLKVQAPAGGLTPELRDHLARRKAEIVDLLKPPTRFIPLKNGPTLPAEVIELGIDLELRGIHLRTDDDHQLVMPTDPRLTDADRSALLRWRHHLGALVEYCAPVIA